MEIILILLLLLLSIYSNNISNNYLLVTANAFPLPYCAFGPFFVSFMCFFWLIFLLPPFFVDDVLLSSLLLLLLFRMISVYLSIFSGIYFFMKEKIKYKKQINLRNFSN
ncbi:hypothetical protein Smp_034310 [Schistosoma mansoni]|uniref:hypothetical protein n=1 Tax=Schistosoma mansoni TaxID=6183 RepID=UPI0001A641BB|nr:hypothetical protein Smp_034310 [Schistosoma mansoni]|eukprot:XP_018649812.1 hypothetical protein Smp_034310 [Schistosoma mansoni]